MLPEKKFNSYLIVKFPRSLTQNSQRLSFIITEHNNMSKLSLRIFKLSYNDEIARDKVIKSWQSHKKIINELPVINVSLRYYNNVLQNLLALTKLI